MHIVFYSVLTASFTAGLFALGTDKVKSMLDDMGDVTSINNQSIHASLLHHEVKQCGTKPVSQARQWRSTLQDLSASYYMAQAVVFALILVNIVKELIQVLQQVNTDGVCKLC